MTKTKTFESYILGARKVSLVKEDSGFVGGASYYLKIEGLYAGLRSDPSLKLGDHKISLKEKEFEELSALLQIGSPDARPHVAGKLEIVSNSN